MQRTAPRVPFYMLRSMLYTRGLWSISLKRIKEKGKEGEAIKKKKRNKNYLPESYGSIVYGSAMCYVGAGRILERGVTTICLTPYAALNL